MDLVDTWGAKNKPLSIDIPRLFPIWPCVKNMEDYVKVLDHWSWLLLFWFCPFFCRLCVVFHCTPYNVAFVVYNTLKSRVHKQCIEITREEKNRNQILLKFFLIGHVAEGILYYLYGYYISTLTTTTFHQINCGLTFFVVVSSPILQTCVQLAVL